MAFTTGSYAVAYGLVGFRAGLTGRKVTKLRVRVERCDDNYVWVRTADLCDAGTPLVLSPEQVEPELNWD